MTGTGERDEPERVGTEPDALAHHEAERDEPERVGTEPDDLAPHEAERDEPERVGTEPDDLAPHEAEQDEAGEDGTEQTVAVGVPGDEVVLGDLTVPAGATGVVVFAHGSGSSRRSGRNRAVAAELRRRSLATLLLDLHPADGPGETGAPDPASDLDALADRLVAAIDLLGELPSTADLPIGCFGASTGAAVALTAAALRPTAVAAVVSRGGRPDLAADHLPGVRAPTLFVVGGADTEVLALHGQVVDRLAAPHRLVEVPGATHLFVEPGALDAVATLTGDWFTTHLHRA